MSAFFTFRDDVSLEYYKEEIMKVDAFARLVKAPGYGWQGFKALDLCYAYKSFYGHLEEDIRKAKIVKDLFSKKAFGGWETDVMKEAIEQYIDKQYDVEMEAYRNNEEQIASTNNYISSLKLPADSDISIEDGEVVDAESTMAKLKIAYALLDTQLDMRKRLRESLLGKLSDKGSKIKGDKEVTWLERKNNEERMRRKNAKQGSEPDDMTPTETKD